MIELTKTRLVREGNKYVDLCLVWTYNGKTYSVRVQPCFKNDFDKLIAIAKDVPVSAISENEH